VSQFLRRIPIIGHCENPANISYPPGSIFFIVFVVGTVEKFPCRIRNSFDFLLFFSREEKDFPSVWFSAAVNRTRGEIRQFLLEISLYRLNLIFNFRPLRFNERKNRSVSFQQFIVFINVERILTPACNAPAESGYV